MDVEVDPAYLGTDKVVVILIDSAAGTRDTLFDDSLVSISQLKSLHPKSYAGQKATILIIGYKDGAVFLSQERQFDGQADRTTRTDTLHWEPAGIREVGFPYDSLTLRAGDPASGLRAQMVPRYASGELSWSSTDTSVVRIVPGPGGSEVLLVPLANGFSRVTVTCKNDLSKADTIRIRVLFALPAQVVPDQAGLNLRPGSWTALATAEVLPPTADPSLSFMVGDTAIAKVAANGKITGSKPGDTWLRISSAADTSVGASIPVHVDSLAAETLRIPAHAITCYLGMAPFSLSHQISPVNASQDAAWESRDTSIVKVAPGGTLTGISAGKAFVVATAAGNPAARDSALVTVKTDPPILSVGTQDTLIALNSSPAFSVGVAQEYGTIALFGWDLDGDGRWDDSASAFPAGTKVLTAPAHPYTRIGSDSIRFYARDGEGNETTASRRIEIIARAPRILSLSADTLVSVNDSITLSARADAPFGKLASFAWDLNGDGLADHNGAFTANPQTLSAGRRFQAAGIYTASLTISDDSGKTAKRQIKLNVLLDAPIADAGPDTSGKPGSAISFRGSALQSFGSIVIYKWDFDGNGLFDDSSAAAGGHVFTYPREGTYNAVLYVRDDDGNTDQDTAKVTILNPAPRIVTIRPDTTISIHDSIPLWGIAADDGKIRKWAWDYDGNAVYDDSGSADAAQADISSGFRYHNQGDWRAILRVTDDLGKAALDTVLVHVLRDDPVADAGTDTSVTINDLIRLRGDRSQDGFGVIVKWEWKVGQGAYVRVSRSDTAVTAPATATAALKCFLRVTDDDGNINLDSVTVRVTAEAPKVTAGPDTAVGLGKQIRLRGSATDDGRIVKYEWSLGDTAVWYQTSRADTNIVAPDSPSNPFRCILRATDEDGFAGRDTTVVKVGMAWTRAGSAVFPPRNGHASLVFSNRMWSLGGGSADATEVFSSSDGAQWRLESSPSGIIGRSGLAATVHGSNMWIIGGSAGWQFNDAWKSQDGTSWSNTAEPGVTPYPARSKHASVSFGGSLFIIGGTDGSFALNDVLTSPNGTNWSASTAPFCPRSEHTAVVFNSRIWVIGGDYSPNATSGTETIWSSANGRDWTPELDLPPFGRRYGHGCAVMNGKIWVVGGLAQGSSVPKNDVWYSSDGVNWVEATSAADFTPRYDHTVLGHNGRLWVIGGTDGGTDGIDDEGAEVWYSSDLP